MSSDLAIRGRLRCAALAISGVLLGMTIGWSSAIAKTTEILVFGDSIAAGFGLPAGEAFPARLEAKLRADGLDVHIVNAGNSGDTTADGLARLDWSLADKPDFVILELGANDALRGAGPQQTRAALDAIIRRLKERRIGVLLAGMLAPRNLGEDYVKAFDPIYPELAAAYRLILYPFIAEGIVGDRALNQPDGIHPTVAGVDVIVSRMLPKVEELIAQVRAAQNLKSGQ